ncbi:DUF4229 domain-containing protein [Leucobacter weissii]|uniref:DUF4229 domain-containing protein n=1 Tax=Leucobacter weissii TaxID=1983706 RepID=A0A939MKF3_9MICO|nr:DUF4229 domain-containing protein [Leucobacter weissii]
MNTRKAWILYAVLRLAFFAVPFALLMLLGWYWWAAALVATLVAASLSVILLSRLRETAAKGVYDWRHQDRTADDIVEDEAIETAESLDPLTGTDDGSVSGTDTGSDTGAERG